jgi:hypothetical protein
VVLDQLLDERVPVFSGVPHLVPTSHNFFSSSLMIRPTKLDRLSLASSFRLALFRKARRLLKELHYGRH